MRKTGFITTILVLLLAFFVVSCNSDGASNTPAVQNATKAFQIGSSNESYDTLKLAVQALKDKSKPGTKAASESYTIRLNWDKTDAGATISGIDAEVKVDFQGHTLTLSDGSEGIVIANTGKAVEIANGTVQVAEGASLKSGTTAVITASTDTTLSASVNASNTDADAIATTGGNFNIQGSAQITSRDDKRTIVATETSVVKVSSSQVILTGGMKLDGNADVDLGDATLKLTQDIEKGDECKLEVKAENVEPQNDNVHQDKIEEARHDHTFSSDWETDDNYHWHAATCEHVTIQGSLAGHSWSEWVVVTEATHTATGTKTRVCSVCGREESEVIPANIEAHTWDDGEVLTEATCSVKGQMRYTCLTCAETIIEDIPIVSNNHTYSVEWSSNNLYHWHVATCGHDVISAQAEHSWDDGVVVDEGENGAPQTIKYTCTICGVEKNITSYSNYYSIDSDGVLYLKESVAKASLTQITVPKELDGKSVVKIADNAFSGYYNLVSVTIEDGVSEIGSSTFKNCIRLVSISTPDSVVEIGDQSFKGCYSLESIVLSDELIHIGEEAFYGCSALSSIVIPSKVQDIGERAFFNCSSATDIVIGNSVEYIGFGAFEGCSSLVNLTTPFVGITKTENNRIGYMFGEDYSGGVNMETFVPASMKSVVITNTTILGQHALNGCINVERIILPTNLTEIGSFALSYCSGITELIIPNSVTTIGSGAMNSCSGLENIILPEGLLSLPSSVFSRCSSLSSVNLPDSLLTIGSYCFSGCSLLSSINIPEKVTTIGGWAFSDCSALEIVSIPDSVLSIGEKAFRNCISIERVIIPDSVISIGDSAFSGCSGITELVLSYSLSSINDSSFAGCSQLTTITIPPAVASMGNSAFKNCSALSTVIMLGNTPPTLSSLVFSGTTILEINVSESAFSSYYGSASWQSYKSLLVSPHTFSSTWTFNSTHHWHAATCGHDVIGGEAEHTWDEGTVITEPQHTEEGVMRYVCTVCGQTKYEVIPELVDDHSFSSAWTSNTTHHWHASTCGHAVINGEAEHTWDEGTITTEASYKYPGIKQYTCTVCGRSYSDVYYDIYYNVGDIGRTGGYIFYDKGFYSDGWRYLEEHSKKSNIFHV